MSSPMIAAHDESVDSPANKRRKLINGGEHKINNNNNNKNENEMESNNNNTTTTKIEKDLILGSEPAFTRLVDLASEVFNPKVIFATDEWFAVAANMFQKAPPIFIPDKYTEFGKWMDGWETRRKRTEGHDWCIIQLGLPGIIHGFEIDTSFFTGNYAPAISVQAANLNVLPQMSGRASDSSCVTPGVMGECARTADFATVSCLQSDQWEELLPMSRLRPGVPETARHFFAVENSSRFTHIRVNIFPDGGVARLRVYGDVVRDWAAFDSDKPVDLASAENGGTARVWSDAHFGKPANLLGPNRAPNMGDGWETARKKNRPLVLRRGGDGLLDLGGHSDWALLKLGTKGTIKQIEIDTNHFKGNFPESCKIDGCLHTDPNSDPNPTDESVWSPLLARTKLEGHTRHYFEGEEAILLQGSITHVRLTIYPDGGISRLRLMGFPDLE